MLRVRLRARRDSTADGRSIGSEVAGTSPLTKWSFGASLPQAMRQAAAKCDLFAAGALEERLHPNFRALRDSPLQRDARALINEIYLRMGDPNGNFVADFQTKGFHSRLFEIACFAYLESGGLAVDRSFERPDFLVSRNGMSAAIEVAVANPTGGGGPDLSALLVEELPDEQVAEKVQREFPRRMLSLLRRKLAKRYHELAHCAGKPLVLLVAPFFEPGAVLYTDQALVDCLYGPQDALDGFFDLPQAASVSAVAYCNQFTVPRFYRMATTFNVGARPSGLRVGVACYDLDDDHLHVKDYRHVLGAEGVPEETWCQGVTLFENPRAAVPLPQDFLPRTSTIRVRDGDLVRELHGFHPLWSFMVIHPDVPE